ncbi:MAG: hypothetical protein K6F42_01775 [Bacteroidales bacterium]|jgi:hypothetical protein|nr:hypothetical protein [Bacteroidales bacterium]MCR5570959.1 hypothetical protein [Bacteroidales bacterium]
MNQQEFKTRIILSCVSLAICIVFLCLGLAGVIGKTSIWVFGGLIIYNVIVTILLVQYQKKHQQKDL